MQTHIQFEPDMAIYLNYVSVHPMNFLMKTETFFYTVDPAATETLVYTYHLTRGRSLLLYRNLIEIHS